MGWSDIWNSTENLFGMGDDAKQPAAGQSVGAVPASDPAVMAGVAPDDVAAIDGAAPATVGASNSAWWEKPLKQMMPMIMGAALHPGQTPRAPAAPGGHGVSANSSGELKTVDELRSTANNNPLDDLNKWAGLFK
jgi:hypothetical protein